MNTVVFSLQAPNNDVYYELTGTPAGLDYFGINKNTGAIYPIRDLYLDTLDTSTYRVSIFLLIVISNTLGTVKTYSFAGLNVCNYKPLCVLADILLHEFIAMLFIINSKELFLV